MMKNDYFGNLTPETFAQLPQALRRFLSYTQHDTTSDPASGLFPSTAAQAAFAKLLEEEMREAGAARTLVTPHAVVMGWLDATPGLEANPAIGLIAHMDTSPEAKGGPVRWRLIDYAGGDIALNDEGVTLELSRFPEVGKYAGGRLVVTDGRTLLGADDKAGVAIVIETLKWFADHPETPHARLCFAITPDEEIGHGTTKFDIDAFGADYAYTMDGGEAGGFETETFNAAKVSAVFHGLNVHPGSAKDKMVNALRIAADFMSRFPAESVPERTSGREGFFHPISLAGSVNEARMTMLIRDHDDARFEDRKAYVGKVAEDMRRAWGDRIDVEVADQYHNLGRFLRDAPVVCELGREAIRRCGLEVVESSVRGGTDGARLAERGLPTPNVFTGGMNYHGVYECLSVEGFLKAVEVARTLCALSADVRTLAARER